MIKAKTKNLILTIIILCSCYYLLILIRTIIQSSSFIDLPNHCNLVLFNFLGQYQQIGLTRILINNIIGNIVPFVLLSIILKRYFSFLSNDNIIFIGFMTSLSFELIQFATTWGIFDVDDILFNTLGCILGILLNHSINNNDKFINFIKE